MSNPTQLDHELAHRCFSAACFNEAWTLIDKPQRTPEETEEMIRLAQVSLWHWTQRPDCGDKERSIGYWQLARVYALAGEAENARKYGMLCLGASPKEDVFCQGYAHEALARAAWVAGGHEEMAEHMSAAKACAARVEDPQNRQLLESDLASMA